MITHTCGHESNRRPRNPKTRDFLENRACGECLVIDVVKKITHENFDDGGRSNLYSKKQGRWLYDTIQRELHQDIIQRGRLTIGNYEVVRMGRAFSKNNNHDVGFVIHLPTIEKLEQVKRLGRAITAAVFTREQQILEKAKLKYPELF